MYRYKRACIQNTSRGLDQERRPLFLELGLLAPDPVLRALRHHRRSLPHEVPEQEVETWLTSPEIPSTQYLRTVVPEADQSP